MSEPTVNELKIEMDGLRALMMEKFASSKDGIIEAKKAQDSYNMTHNDLVRQMGVQTGNFITRLQVDDKLNAIEQKIHSQSTFYDARFNRMDLDVRKISDAMNAQIAKGIGMENLWGKIVALIGAAGAAGYTVAVLSK